ncbi:MAG: DUF1816 domain-containing protein [Nostoc sp.]|uniref:DUF1816 domain-containing protein n=1 Tax=Nostoc sp. TaxID=1180 RepID=UPI002FFB00B4
MNLFQSNQSEFAWWVEINTAVPRCTYYFGPFDSEKEAQFSRTGYIDDLYQEEARDIIAIVKQCQPNVLTIFQDNAEFQISSF